jgi:hypothetical protein
MAAASRTILALGFQSLADLPHPSDQQLQEAIDSVLAKNSREITTGY